MNISRRLALVSLYALTGILAVAAAPAQAESCPNAQFRTGPSAHLPDCRAYEQVSPPVKDAAGVLLHQAGPNGSSALLEIFAAVGGLEGFPDAGTLGPTGWYSTQRTASGWSLFPDDPPSSEYLTTGYGANPDLAEQSEDGLTTVFTERGVSRPENSLDLYVRRPDRSIVDIGPALPPSAPSGPPISLGRDAGLKGAGVSADGSRAFFLLKDFHWPGDGTLNFPRGQGFSLYEYVGTGNTTPLLVGVNNEGKEIGQCGNGFANGAGNAIGPTGSMSANGNVVVFAVRPTQDCTEEGLSGSAPPVAEFFVRLNNDQPQSPLDERGECTVAADACTVAISEPSKADCAACDTEPGVLAEPHFLGVSEDGSKVFFTTEQELLPGAIGMNIYKYDFAAPAGKKVVRVSAGDSTVSNPELETNPEPVISEDGSHVYFVAKGVLTTTPNREGQSAEAGADNLYVFDTVTGSTAFIAHTALEAYRGTPASEADATPDGRFLVFTSSGDLTPDDTSTAAQVFEYDAQTGALTRISIGQDGFGDNGNAALSGSGIRSPEDVGYSPKYWTRSSVSADGSYVFFESTAGLTPQAFNEKVVGYMNLPGLPVPVPVYAENVYEYHAGRVSLISDGRDIGLSAVHSAVELLGTDASGGDVFFTTVDPLVGQDTDTDIDIYDARVKGGFPAPVAPSSCAGEECQGALSGAPTLLSPGSQFQAGGNPPLAAPAPAAVSKPKAKPKKCKKRKTLKHNKCTKAKAKKAGRARRASR